MRATRFCVSGGGVMSGPGGYGSRGYGPGGWRLWFGGGAVGPVGLWHYPPMNRQTCIKTRMHSSRMHTTCSLTVSHSIRLRGGGCLPNPLDADPLPVNRMTQRCKNITLPQPSFPGGKNYLPTTSFAGGKYKFHYTSLNSNYRSVK